MKATTAERRLQLKNTVARAANESARLGEAVQLYGALIDALMLETPVIELPDLSSEAIEAKLAAGKPICTKNRWGSTAGLSDRCWHAYAISPSSTTSSMDG